MLEQVCPILPSRDLAVSRTFYESWGFTVWYDDGNYLLLNRDHVEIHFFHHPEHVAAQSDHGVYVRPKDVDAISDELADLKLPSNKGFPRFAAAEDKPWGMREAALWDPDGNLLRFGQEAGNG